MNQKLADKWSKLANSKYETGDEKSLEKQVEDLQAVIREMTRELSSLQGALNSKADKSYRPPRYG